MTSHAVEDAWSDLTVVQLNRLLATDEQALPSFHLSQVLPEPAEQPTSAVEATLYGAKRRSRRSPRSIRPTYPRVWPRVRIVVAKVRPRDLLVDLFDFSPVSLGIGCVVVLRETRPGPSSPRGP